MSASVFPGAIFKAPCLTRIPAFRARVTLCNYTGFFRSVQV
jgi:hypothetical protein